jgi:hypothetical protein
MGDDVSREQEERKRHDQEKAEANRERQVRQGVVSNEESPPVEDSSEEGSTEGTKEDQSGSKPKSKAQQKSE